jgi:sirohydrochlorin ferrochelatase
LRITARQESKRKPATVIRRILKGVSEAIILFSHGSLLCGAGENLRELADTLRRRGDAPMVEVGYLNYSEPRFASSFERCVAAGASAITVVPYFLVAGYFVKVDLPREIDAVRAQHPQIKVRVADAMCFHPSLADALLTCAGRAGPPAQWRDILNTAPQFCQQNPHCPLYGSEKCRATAQGRESQVMSPASRAPVSKFQDQRSNDTTSEALLVMVHGSPRPESNRDMYGVVDVIRESGVFPIVEVGFMECNEPSIPTAVESCVEQGAQRVIAVPYFLHTGNHVADDLPGLLEEAQERHPRVEFLMGDYIGHDPLIADVIRDRAAQANTVPSPEFQAQSPAE